MRRLAALLVALVAVTGALAVAGARDAETDAISYRAELDNAFGLVEGGDLKVAGVRAGTITDLDLDEETHRAIVAFEVTENGFGSLREDVRCEARPQSLIGEYFLDCLPGSSARELAPGSTIPVERTASTIPPDLVGNILRRPYRERLAILLGELGAGVGGHGGDLDAALRRAVPALRETDAVLAKLARQNRVLGDLARDADAVLADLAGNRDDVGRFVVEARDTAKASAQRRTELAEGFRRLPGFLAELEPTMAALGDVATEQTPALRDLRATSGELERLLENLGPLAEASRPAVRSLGEASVTGREAVRAAAEPVKELARFGTGAPEVGTNLRFVLEHLADRDAAVEPDERSPGGKGYTGFEALLQYVYDQTLSTNIYDQNSHILNISLIPPTDACAAYADVERAHDPATKDCASALGPNQPGVNFPDPSAGPERATARERGEGGSEEDAPPPPPHALPSPDAPPGAAPAPAAPTAPAAPLLPGLPDVLDAVEGLLPQVPDALEDLGSRREPLLDYLLGR